MKTRNNSSKAFHSGLIKNNKPKQLEQLVDCIISKIDNDKDFKKSINSYKQIIQRCYNNKKQQQQLCQILNLPFISGPIALNSIPYYFYQQQYLNQNQFNKQDIELNVMNQINHLFQYLKKTKEYFYCWIVYYNQQLKLLHVKMMKKYQLRENVQLLNSKYCLIGIFVNREVNLSVKKFHQQSPIKNNLNENQKLSAFSCYDKPQNNLFQKEIKSKNKLKKVTQKINNSQSIYSLKSFKSSSKTNSSSFKNSNSNKQRQASSSINDQSEVIQNQQSKNNNNFKKKKEKVILFAQSKIGKSISSKFQAPKNNVKVMKSLQKVQFYLKNTSPRSIKSQQKRTMFRSISNTQKTKKNNQSHEIFNGNKTSTLKQKPFINEILTKQAQKKPANFIKRKLSKNGKIYSSSGSLTIASSQTTKTFLKQKQQKIPSNLIKRKISSNIPSFKKKKIQIKYQNSSKNSFNIE